MRPCRALLLVLSVVLLANPVAAAEDRYVEKRASRDGTGRIYMGREIALVMGIQGAAWLERSGRRREERPDLLVDNLPVEADDVVADVGAGTGYFTEPIARRLVDGKVLAVDLQPEMLRIVERRAEAAGLSNIETIRASETDPGLEPRSVDLALFVDVYHEIAYPFEVMTAVVEALRPGGRVVLVEYRAEDPRVPIKRLHKMSQRQAVREMEAVGLVWQETRDMLPQQHFMIFRKPLTDAASTP